MLTDKDDLVLDPFGGSCVTGEVAERLQRRWICVELVEEYLIGALGRFVEGKAVGRNGKPLKEGSDSNYYRLPRPGILWNGVEDEPLPADGGQKRSKQVGKAALAGAPPAKSKSDRVSELSAGRAR